MTSDKLNFIRGALHKSCPLIHCITNPVSINQCANALLAVGARPIMAEHPDEVSEITSVANALMLNLGNITDVRIESMLISSKIAQKKAVPLLIDAVGVACSSLRKSFLLKLVERNTPSIIKGNYSEIHSLYSLSYHCAGVDADNSLSVKTVAKAAVTLARKYGCVILASGKRDIVTDGKRLIFIDNGTSSLSFVTGTGCMLGALCSAYLSVSSPLESAVTGCAILGICGELSKNDGKNGSFMVSLMDNLSSLSDYDITNYLKVSEIQIENL